MSVDHKYNTCYFWQNLLYENRFTWEGAFEQRAFTRESLIIETLLVNCYGQSDHCWTYFPNHKAVIGFLKHVFLPASFVTWCIGEQERETIIPLGDGVMELFEDLRTSEKHIKKERIPFMQGQLHYLDFLWGLNKESMIHELQRFSETFNRIWLEEKDIFFGFYIHLTPMDAAQHLIQCYEDGDINMLGYIKEKIEMSKEDWFDLASQVDQSEFARKRFFKILNEKLENEF